MEGEELFASLADENNLIFTYLGWQLKKVNVVNGKVEFEDILYTSKFDEAVHVVQQYAEDVRIISSNKYNLVETEDDNILLFSTNEAHSIATKKFWIQPFHMKC